MFDDDFDAWNARADRFDGFGDPDPLTEADIMAAMNEYEELQERLGESHAAG